MEKPNHKYLIIIVGPTAVGKTDLCVDIATELRCDIISCDSRQFYKELNIGTAKPSLAEMKGVAHHFIDNLSIEDEYSVGDFEREVDVFLEKYFQSKDVIIMTGGSGLFVQAVVSGLDDMPKVPAALRQELMEKLKTESLEVLQSQLKELDIDTYNSIDIQNPQRVVRALEVCIDTKKSFSEYKQNIKKVQKEYQIIKIGIDRPREELYQRINTRVDNMIDQGLLAEVQALVNYKNQNALKTVGYKEVFAYFDGEISNTEMVEKIKQNTRRYAKRQLTWFKNKDEFKWFNADDPKGIKEYIYEKILK